MLCYLYYGSNTLNKITCAIKLGVAITRTEVTLMKGERQKISNIEENSTKLTLKKIYSKSSE